MIKSTTPTNSIFPVTHSVLSASALPALVSAHYSISEVVDCRLLHRGLTDTYVLVTARDRYILRAYRAGWRADSDILYEVDVLHHLAGKGVAVATPIASDDGGYLQCVQAPEERRQLVLFAYARGKAVGTGNAHVAEFGRAAAEIHAATGDFASPHARFSLDVDELLDRPLAAMQPRLAHRPGDWSYVERVADRLRERLSSMPSTELEWGFCHGDLHEGNAHIEDGRLTFFDFDCCGPGWRAYDVAVFLWVTSLWAPKKARQRWEVFLAAYRERRVLREIDLAAVSLFIAVRHIWLLGLHAGNGQDWSFGWMDDAYYDRALKFLRTWEKQHLHSN